MKCLLVGLLLLTAGLAMASVEGLPSEDPVVMELRMRFERARSPEAKELIGKKFSCQGKIAYKGSFSNDLTSEKTFVSYKGKIQQVSLKSKSNHMMMLDNTKEIIGVVNLRGAAGYEAIRIDEKGDLISEWSVTLNPSSDYVEPIAQAGNGSLVVSYGSCNLNP